MSIKKKIPEPISLTPLENVYYGLKGDEPEKFIDREPGEGFMDRISVEYKTKDGKLKHEKLATVADPKWDPNGGNWGLHDGYLSYPEAKGKTFFIPNYFCNSTGTTIINVKNFSDFKSLRTELERPLFNELHRPWRCVPGESTSKSNPTTGPVLSDPQDHSMEDSAMGVLETGVSFFWDQLPDREEIQEKLFEALNDMGNVTALATLPSIALRAGVGKILQDLTESGKIDWEGFEEAINQSPAEETFEDEEGGMCTDDMETDNCSWDDDPWGGIEDEGDGEDY